LFQRMDDSPFKKNAKFSDLDRIPDGWVGEIIDGNLYAFPRPSTQHGRALGRLFKQVDDEDDDNQSGWIILQEPAVRLGKNVLVPDIAGWRRTRMREMPLVRAIDLAPDWVCEGLSPSTARIDKGRKRELYAQYKVGHLWYVDADKQYVDVLKLDGTSYLVIKAACGKSRIALPPFAQRITLAKLWKR
jgi:Uma2 family endonuclease